ncbi:MAG: tRNA-dihydrouridine synthase, partial [Lachnospiraceae bacterium]|nr:tRNA-dihydrouridine synthase [Lachnospiraceae bacterium]
PWIFKEIKEYLKNGKIIPRPGISEIRDMILRHAALMIEYKGEYTGIHEMRKHVAWYTQGLKNSAKLRARVNAVESYKELEGLIKTL